MNSNLAAIIGDWVAKTLPHFSVETYSGGGWLGWVKCPCELKHGAAIARIETDRICFISERPSVYGRSHEERCTAAERNPTNFNCYCGETVIMIYDSEGFSQLKQLVKSTHSKLVRHRRPPRC